MVFYQTLQSKAISDTDHTEQVRVRGPSRMWKVRLQGHWGSNPEPSGWKVSTPPTAQSPWPPWQTKVCECLRAFVCLCSLDVFMSSCFILYLPLDYNRVRTVPFSPCLVINVPICPKQLSRQRHLMAWRSSTRAVAGHKGPLFYYQVWYILANNKPSHHVSSSGRDLLPNVRLIDHPYRCVHSIGQVGRLTCHSFPCVMSLEGELVLTFPRRKDRSWLPMIWRSSVDWSFWEGTNSTVYWYESRFNNIIMY